MNKIHEVVWHLCLYIVVLLPYSLLLSQESADDVLIRLESDYSAITFGDSVTVTAIVEAPIGVDTGIPALHDNAVFYDTRLSWKRDADTQDQRVAQYGFTTFVYSPDSVSIGPFMVGYVDAEGDSAYVVSNQLSLVVQPVAAHAQDSLRGLRGPERLPSSGLPLWAVIIAAALILLIAFVAAYKLLFEREEESADAVQEIDERAIFLRLRAMGLAEKGRYNELYSYVSRALRGFIHRNMGVEALYSTTYEILTALERTGVDRKAFEEIRTVFNEADMVKFARYVPSGDEAGTVTERALGIVDRVLELQRLAEERHRAELAQCEEESKPENEATPG